MNVIWITNEVLPEASLLRKQKPSPFGGWLVYASELIAKSEDIHLTIVSPDATTNEIITLQGDHISHIIYPKTLDNHLKTKSTIEQILSNIQPDIIHVYGSENYHALAVGQYCKEHKIKFIVSIQGLVSIYASHYVSGVPADIQKRYTIRDFLKHDRIIDQQVKFEKRGLLETELIQLTDHVIGRTDWDYACTKWMNPKATYHFCNETLRKGFYDNNWSIETKISHRLFTSQAYYPIKGFHFLLDAIHILHGKYPDLTVHVAGEDYFSANNLKAQIKQSSYSKYIRNKIKSLNLSEVIHFTGVLNEKEMIKEYQQAHTFVMPSTIENSPNSIGEAMILGVPVVAANVGGIGNLIDHNINGFTYQHDAPYMLAHYIDTLWSDNDLAQKISKQAKQKANLIHHPITNRDTLIQIYKDILKE